MPSERRTQRLWRKEGEYSGYDKQRGHITIEVKHVHRVEHGLDCHNCTMHDARPDVKGNQTQMFTWVAGGYEQKDAQGPSS